MKCIMFGEKILDYWDDIMKDLGDIIAIPSVAQPQTARIRSARTQQPLWIRR